MSATFFAEVMFFCFFFHYTLAIATFQCELERLLLWRSMNKGWRRLEYVKVLLSREGNRALSKAPMITLNKKNIEKQETLYQVGFTLIYI